MCANEWESELKFPKEFSWISSPCRNNAEARKYQEFASSYVDHILLNSCGRRRGARLRPPWGRSVPRRPEEGTARRQEEPAANTNQGPARRQKDQAYYTNEPEVYDRMDGKEGRGGERGSRRPLPPQAHPRHQRPAARATDLPNSLGRLDGRAGGRHCEVSLRRSERRSRRRRGHQHQGRAGAVAADV